MCRYVSYTNHCCSDVNTSRPLALRVLSTHTPHTPAAQSTAPTRLLCAHVCVSCSLPPSLARPYRSPQDTPRHTRPPIYLKQQEALCAFPGVGRKVADCVALFSLDQQGAIPVDVHVRVCDDFRRVFSFRARVCPGGEVCVCVWCLCLHRIYTHTPPHQNSSAPKTGTKFAGITHTTPL